MVQTSAVMKKLYIITFILLSTICVNAQQSYKFYAGNGVKFLKQNNDSLRYPFTGGFNAPQFSNIDLNQDGINDLFIFDRASQKVTTFLKQPQGYKLTPEYSGRFPFMNDWALLRDVDGDGKMDIFTEINSDRRFLRDTIQNVFPFGLRLFKNKSTVSGGLNFLLLNNQEMDTGGFWIDFGVKKAPERVGMNNTDIPGIGDIDGDGDADILSFQQLDLSPFYYDNFLKNKYSFQYKPDSTRFILRDQCWGFMQFDGASLRNRFSLGKDKSELGACVFQMYGKHRKHAGTTLCMLDYNGDGVQDIIYGDVGFNNLVLLINGKNSNSRGRDSIIAQDTAFPSNTVPAQFIRFPAPYYVDADGDGKRELLITTNDAIGAKSVNNVWRYNNTGTDAKPVFQFVGNNHFIYDETIDLGTRSVPVLTDIDGDGDQDLLVATNGDYAQTFNLKDRLVLFINTPESNGRSVYKMQDTNFMGLSNQFPIINIHPTFADLDGDGKQDLIIGMESGEMLFYKNKSVGTNYNFEKQTSPLDIIDVGGFAAPTFADLDGDLDLDLVVGNRDGILKLFLNRGSVSAALFSNTPTIDSFGGVTTQYCFNTTYNIISCEPYGYATPILYDLNDDGKQELMVGSDIGYVSVYFDIDTMPGTKFKKLDDIFVDYSKGGNTANEIRFGRRAAPCVGKLDGDNKPDVLVGTITGGLQFYGSKVTTGVGVDEATEANNYFKIYPNPATYILVLVNQNMPGDAEYILHDYAGRKVLNGTFNQYYSEKEINVSALESGFYFLTLQGDRFKQTQKVLIQR